ncbi:unnamed protein product, partial [Porites evermanni]
KPARKDADTSGYKSTDVELSMQEDQPLSARNICRMARELNCKK